MQLIDKSKTVRVRGYYMPILINGVMVRIWIEEHDEHPLTGEGRVLVFVASVGIILGFVVFFWWLIQ